MPYINIRLNQEITKAQDTELFSQTTQLMQRLMGKNPLVTVVHIENSPAQKWAVNGTSQDQHAPTSAYVDIKITEGTNSTQDKAAMISATTQMLKDVLGTIQEACYVVIHDIRGDSWGYEGITQASRAASKKAAQLEPGQTSL